MQIPEETVTHYGITLNLEIHEEKENGKSYNKGEEIKFSFYHKVKISKSTFTSSDALKVASYVVT